MKVIVSQLDALRGYVSREFYYIITELISRYGWKHIDTYRLWNWNGSLERRLREQFGRIPETILFWEGYDFLHAHARELYRMQCRKFVLADDLHWWTADMRKKKLVGYALCDTILATYGYAWSRFYPELAGAKRVVWIPHSAGPDFMRAYNRQPKNAIFLSGAINHYYPMRQVMRRLETEGRYPIVYKPHPGYHCGYDHQNDVSVGRGYAESLNEHRAAFTDGLIFKYVVAKHFEIPATGALLLADESLRKPLRELGFIEDEHYVSFSRESIEDRLHYILDRDRHAELDEIRRRGQELVWARHKTSDRARQIDEVCSN
jgi:hypothetical protein